MNADWKKPDTKGYVLHDPTYTSLPEKEIHTGLKQNGGYEGLGGQGGYLMGAVSDSDDENALEMDDGGDCTMWTYLTPLHSSI